MRASPPTTANEPETRAEHPDPSPKVRRGWPATALVFLIALAALAPTVGDFGLTWDEPAYRYSQVFSSQWWERWTQVRSWSNAQELLDADALLYYWPYARFGVNFHPPLAGQLSLAGHAVFGHWMKDIPSRRMASVIEFALTIAIGFHFLSRRYGAWVGAVMAGTLLLTPRLYGQAHLLDTDIPGLLLWAAAALAFWNGLNEPNGRRWRVLLGVLMGLAFLEKMAAVVVLLPLLLWMLLARRPSNPIQREGRADWIDAAFTAGLMLLPLGLAFIEVQSLQRRLPPPSQADLFIHRPPSDLPGLILAAPLAVWLLRRFLARRFPKHRIWGAERPRLEILTAIMAFAPVVAWLGNPAWWRETLVRMTHYYTLSNDRQGALPDIFNIYFGQIYKYSLPWHNAWILLAITTPATILLAAAVGMLWGLRRTKRDKLPLYFLLHLLTLPALRMLPTPAHDGVRLFLPTFFFLSAFAGWGAMAAAKGLAAVTLRRLDVCRAVIAALVLFPPLVSLVRVHPYELSYYNILIGWTPGAWGAGFELTYWYDAFTPQVIRELNDKFPPNAEVDFLNPKTNPEVFIELQSLGHLRPDLRLGRRDGDRFPFAWLLTQDSKASGFSRLLFGMKPWYASTPSQLDGLRVLSVADPVAVSRAWALSLMLDRPVPAALEPPASPGWVREYAPILARFWGDGLEKDGQLKVNDFLINWAKTDPAGLRGAAAELVASKGKPGDDPNAKRLFDQMTLNPDGTPSSFRRDLLSQVMRARPEALIEAAEILTERPDALVRLMTRYGYTDPQDIGGYLDEDL